jgi:perosamine synthetase
MKEAPPNNNYSVRPRIIPWGNPGLVGSEQEYVRQALESTWFSEGDFNKQFEGMFAKLVGTKNAVSAANGTAALHLAMLALGLGPGHEVIVPGYTFAASGNAVLHAGATPIFCDVDPNNWLIDLESAGRCVSRRTKAIVVVHLHGNIPDMRAIADFAASHNIAIVDDAAQAAGSTFEKKAAGTFGEVGCFSFQATKLITTGEGGMVVTNNSALADRVRLFKNHGMAPGRKYWHTVIGYNYRLTNLQAAIGCAQLEMIDQLIAALRERYDRYRAALRQLPHTCFQQVDDRVMQVPFGFPIRITQGVFRENRDVILASLAADGIETRPGWTPFSVMPPYVSNPLPNAELVSSEMLILPLYPRLTPEEIDFIADRLLVWTS